MSSPEKPMLQELVAILGVPTLLEEIDDCQFITCLARTKQDVRCGKTRKDADQQKSMALWNEFSLMEECVLTEGLQEKIQSFIRSSFCYYHNSDGSVAVKGFNAWLKSRGKDKPVLTNSVPSEEESSSSNLSSVSFSQDTTIIANESDIHEAPTESGAKELVQTQNTSDDMETTCIEVEAVTEVLSAMTVTNKEVKATAVVTTFTDKTIKAAAVVTTTTKSDTRASETQTITAEVVSTHIDGLGNISMLQRKDSLRSPAPLLQEIYRYLQPSEQEEGIVYVLKHKSEGDLFKIGYTRYNSERRQMMGKQCNIDNSETIYQSPEGPFFAAKKAERLAQVCLRQHNLKVENCHKCDGCHREWFRASERDVLYAVDAMEKFVRLPGYAKCPETKEWKISSQGYDRMKLFCNASPQNIGALLCEEQGRTASKDPSDLTEKISSEDERSVKDVVGPETRTSEESFNEDTSPKKPLAIVESVELEDTKPTPRRTPVGAKLVRGWRAARDGVSKAKKNVSKIIPRSRDGTAEPESLPSMSSAEQPNGMTMEEYIQNSFWGFDAAGWNHLGKRVINEVENFVADVQDEIRRGDQGGETTKA